MRRGLFFFFFFFFACHFSKPVKFVLGLPKWNVLPGKSIQAGWEKITKSRKNDFAPSEKFSCYGVKGQPEVSSLAASETLLISFCGTYIHKPLKFRKKHATK